jgi:hypothetical protein
MHRPDRDAAMPPMREFNVSNSLLFNRAALDAAWERDGYWFFRDVLDQSAVGRLRAVYMDTLKAAGVMDRDASEPVYNGASLDNFKVGVNTGRAEDVYADPLLARHPMKDFVAEPAIRDFFKQLIGDEPWWVPITEYHAAPPRREHRSNRFNFIHQDSSHNPGIPFRICWIPVAAIDEKTGGLALTEGLHKPRPNDFVRPPEGIPQEVIPADSWRRTNYRPGDLLMFDLNSPHSGLANHSSRYFRLSMDIRLLRASDNVPTVGTVAGVDQTSVTVAGNDGKNDRFLFEDGTYCRSYNGVRIPIENIPRTLKIGDPVIVASENGRARVIRPQH